VTNYVAAGALGGCSSLTAVVIPGTVVNIGFPYTLITNITIVIIII
jgi:hypothetical protein